jgi:uncharacterized protein YrrD
LFKEIYIKNKKGRKLSDVSLSMHVRKNVLVVSKASNISIFVHGKTMEHEYFA